MIRQVRMPSPAMAVALLALFAALAGGAYAASKAPKNSVVSSSIRNGQVRSADIADRGVRAADLGAGSVGPDKLAPGAVGADKLAPGAVGADKLAPGSVGADKLAPGAVGAAALRAGAVGTDVLANGAVSGAKLAPGAVNRAAIGPGAIGPDQIAANAAGPVQIAPGSVGSDQFGTILRVVSQSPATTDADGVTNGGAVGIAKVTAFCPAGSRVLSGGTRWVENTNNGTLDANVYIQQESASSQTSWEAEGIVDFGAAGSIKLQAEAYCLLSTGSGQ